MTTIYGNLHQSKKIGYELLRSYPLLHFQVLFERQNAAAVDNLELAQAAFDRPLPRSVRRLIRATNLSRNRSFGGNCKL